MQASEEKADLTNNSNKGKRRRVRTLVMRVSHTILAGYAGWFLHSQQARDIAATCLSRAEWALQESAGLLRSLRSKLNPQAGARLTWPLANFRITSSFGTREHPVLGASQRHDGIDLGAPMGAPIHSSGNGIVSFAGVSGGFGKLVKVEHRQLGLETWYGHLSKIRATVGQRVDADNWIGDVGSSGRATGPHLHFEVRDGGQPVDPVQLIDQPAPNR